MRTIILILFLVPSVSFSQTQNVFIKLTDAKGTQINGDATTRGFERWMKASTITPAGRNNIQLNFTMNIAVSSAELKKAMANGELLLNGEVNVMQPGNDGIPQPAYTIKMEKIIVLACTETMGCNNNMTTSVSLQATRIGWTYYAKGKTEIMVVSNKYGYDAETSKEWTNF